MKIKLFSDFFPTVKGLHNESKENINDENANDLIAPQLRVIAMELFEAHSNILSTQEELVSNEKETKRKLASGMKEVEVL